MNREEYVQKIRMEFYNPPGAVNSKDAHIWWEYDHDREGTGGILVASIEQTKDERWRAIEKVFSKDWGASLSSWRRMDEQQRLIQLVGLAFNLSGPGGLKLNEVLAEFIKIESFYKIAYTNKNMCGALTWAVSGRDIQFDDPEQLDEFINSARRA
ncbi:MAG: hypothetical protein GVY33_11285 [Alphaproteobacteria bacterium]|jgi:hypothetical protein|nr:hypothetical protein [Alphaproteobacteria bacterium]